MSDATVAAILACALGSVTGLACDSTPRGREHVEHATAESTHTASAKPVSSGKSPGMLFSGGDPLPGSSEVVDISEPGCDGVFVDAPISPPVWERVDLSSEPLTECLAGSSHDPKEPYDACVAKDFGLEGCDLPWGHQFCKSTYWTVLCNSTDQCPSGMVCTWGHGVGTLPSDVMSYGWCVKSCAGTGEPSDCIRCDMYCDTALGICRKESVDAMGQPVP